jgi:hypothetical protein
VEKKDSQGKSKKDLIEERKKKLLSMSRKEKKMQKRLELLENELREAELEQNENVVLKLVNDLFYPLIIQLMQLCLFSIRTL